MTQTKEERPLVTFALFAYNQEKYIREAVEGAFSQTYEPLEIILSDDCSSDRTFEIMQEMAAEYKGPHKIVLNRNSKNLGTIDHLLSVAHKARGELLIVAAGDDVSLPARCQRLVAGWMQARAGALYSDCATIDSSGALISPHHRVAPSTLIQRIFSDSSLPQRYDGLVRNIPGYSAAYSTKVLQALPPCENGALNEDALTTMVFNILGLPIYHVEEPLLEYRYAESSVSSHFYASSVQSIISDEKKKIAFARSSRKFYPYLVGIIDKIYPISTETETIKKGLRTNYRLSEILSEVGGRNFVGRLKLLRDCETSSEIRIVITRLAGLFLFASLKKLVGSVNPAGNR